MSIEDEIYKSEHAMECMACGTIKITGLDAMRSFDRETQEWLSENAKRPRIDEDSWVLPKKINDPAIIYAIMQGQKYELGPGRKYTPMCRDCAEKRRLNQHKEKGVE